jgi:hypothetical protein
MIALVLMLAFFILSAALYLIGLVVVDHANVSMQLDHKVHQYYNWVSQYGSPEQKQAAKAAIQSGDLENLQSLVGIDPVSS